MTAGIVSTNTNSLINWYYLVFLQLFQTANCQTKKIENLNISKLNVGQLSLTADQRKEWHCYRSFCKYGLLKELE